MSSPRRAGPGSSGRDHVVKINLQEAFEEALDRHYADGYTGELLLGYDASRNSEPWFVVDDNAPLDVLSYGKTAIKALRTYTRQGAPSR